MTRPSAPPTPARRSLGRSPVVLGLAALNVLLLGSLAARHLPGQVTHAQNAPGGAAGAGGTYIMLAGEASGLPSDVVYIVDTDNNAVLGVGFNTNTNRLQALPPVDLGRLLDDAAAGGGNNAGGPPTTPDGNAPATPNTPNPNGGNR